jgi:hypothetical protein
MGQEIAENAREISVIWKSEPRAGFDPATSSVMDYSIENPNLTKVALEPPTSSRGQILTRLSYRGT